MTISPYLDVCSLSGYLNKPFFSFILRNGSNFILPNPGISGETIEELKSWSKCDITLREINNNHILTIISDSINQKNVAIKMIINIIGPDNLFPYIHPATNTNDYNNIHFSPPPSYNNNHFNPPPPNTNDFIPMSHSTPFGPPPTFIPHSHSHQLARHINFSPPPPSNIPFNTPSNKNYSIPPVSNQQYSIPSPLPNKLVNDISKLEKENCELQNQINDMNNINKEQSELIVKLKNMDTIHQQKKTILY